MAATYRAIFSGIQCTKHIRRLGPLPLSLSAQGGRPVHPVGLCHTLSVSVASLTLARMSFGRRSEVQAPGGH